MRYTMSLMLMAVTAATADEAAFRLRDYRPPEYEHRSLTVVPEFNFEHEWHSDVDVLDSTVSPRVDSTPVDLDIGAELQYDRIVYREMYQTSDYARLSGGYRHSDRIYKDSYYSSYYVSEQELRDYADAYLSISKDIQWYLSKSVFANFKEGITAKYMMAGIQHYTEYDTTLYYGGRYASSESNELKVTVEPGMYLGFGVGRSCNVTYARSALYIIDLLKRQGRLRGPDDVAAITALADEIVRISKRRFFDTRLHNIEAVNDLHAYMMQAGLVDSIDMHYAAELFDLWQYCGLQGRSSGMKVQAGFDIMYTFDYSGRDISDGVYVVRNTYGNSALELRLDYSLPLDPVWQFDARYEFRKPFNYLNDSYEYYYSDGYRFPIIEEWESYSTSTVSAAVRYLPNTRTTYKFSSMWDRNGGKLGYVDSDVISIDIRNNYFTMDCAVEHYFSPRLKVIAGYGILFQKDDDVWPYVEYMTDYLTYRHDKREWLQHRADLTVVYSIF